MRIRQRRFRVTPLLARLLAAFIVILTLIICLDVRLRPHIKTVFAHNSGMYVRNAVNECVYDALTAEGLKYSDLAELSFTEDGYVTSVQMRTTDINRLKSSLIVDINNRLGSMRGDKISISLGTASGLVLLNGRGPRLNVKVFPYALSDAYFTSEFISAGVNQTLHRITLVIECGVTAVAPGYTSKGEVKTELLIAETVIVGKIPESFTYISGDDRDIVSKINDYSSVNE